MAVFGSGAAGPEETDAKGSAPAEEISAAGRRFEMALLVASLPAAGREACIRMLLPLALKRPPWPEDEVSYEAAEQCRDWWRPLGEAQLRQQTPRSLLFTMQTEIEGGLRSAATPLWLLNRIVRRVWLLHQGQRVGQVYRELERKLGDAALAVEQVYRMIVDLARVGIL